MSAENMNVLDVVKSIRLRRGNCFLWNKSFQEQLVAHARVLNLLGEPLPETPAMGHYPANMFPTVEEVQEKKVKSNVRNLF